MSTFVSVLFGAVIFLYVQLGQPTRETSAAQPLGDFFRTMVENYDPSALPKFGELLNEQRQIGGMRPAEISKALPSILSALLHDDDTVKSYAAAALFSIAQRPDSAALLGPSVGTIAEPLERPNIHLQDATVQILGMLRPEPVPETIPLLLRFVKRSDRSIPAQIDGFSVLLRIAAQNPDAISALQSFISRPLDEHSRESLINGIANSHTQNLQAADMLIAALDDPSEQVRFQAAQAFQRMPQVAVLRAAPTLRKLAKVPTESPEIKAAAQEALKGVERQK